MIEVANPPVLGCHAWTFGQMGYPAAIGRIADLGFDAVDLPVGGAGDVGVYPSEALLGNPAAAADIAAFVAHRGIRISDVFLLLPHAINDPDPQRRGIAVREFRGAMPALKELGTPGVTISPGVRGRGDEREPTFERSAHALEALVEEAARSSLALSIEPHIGSTASTPGEAEELVERVSGLALTLDYSHFIAAGVPQASVEPLHAHARHVHIRQSSRGRLAAPVGEGVIDFDRVFSLLRTTGYAGAITVEYADSPWMDQDAVDVLAQTVALADQARRLIAQHWKADRG